MTEAAAHDEEVKDLMAAEGRMMMVEQRQLQRIDHTADRIDDASGEQPGELRGTQGVQQLWQREDAQPSHRDVEDGRDPLRTIDPEELQDAAQKGDAPDDRQHRQTAPFSQREQADRRIAAGDEDEDHHVVDLLAQCVGAFAGIKGVVTGACGIQPGHRQRKDPHGDGQQRIVLFYGERHKHASCDQRQKKCDQMSDGTSRILEAAKDSFLLDRSA